MADLIEVKAVDREFYESRIRGFVPGRAIDVHTHVWEEPRAVEASGRVAAWPSRVAASNPIGGLLETYRLLLPGKDVVPLIFGSPTASGVDGANEYVRRCAADHNLPALLLARPEWTAAQLEQRIEAGGFIGVKVYLSYAPAYLPADEIRIFDFLPPHQLQMLDERGFVVMLHIPRPMRLRDPVNLAQLLEIDRRYPNAKVIVAHVGRAYCEEDAVDAFEELAGTERLMFDISANTNEAVFRRLIAAVGPKRILFGSDMPILRMRMRRICENGRYVNLVPRGMYGDVSGDPHMREVSGAEAAGLTFFLYEEIDAFRRAADAEGLTAPDVADVFCNNAHELLGFGPR